MSLGTFSLSVAASNCSNSATTAFACGSDRLDLRTIGWQLRSERIDRTRHLDKMHAHDRVVQLLSLLSLLGLCGLLALYCFLSTTGAPVTRGGAQSYGAEQHNPTTSE